MDLRRVTVSICLLLGLFYLLPVPQPQHSGVLWLRIAGALLLLAILVRRVVRTVVAGMQASSGEVRLERILLALNIGVVGFAYVELLLTRLDPTQFDGLETRTDALYFAITTLSTTGYGDIHPAGQLGRAVVTGQLLFDIIVVAAGARILVREIATHGKARSSLTRSGGADQSGK